MSDRHNREVAGSSPDDPKKKILYPRSRVRSPRKTEKFFEKKIFFEIRNFFTSGYPYIRNLIFPEKNFFFFLPTGPGFDSRQCGNGAPYIGDWSYLHRRLMSCEIRV
jgi:hypothetical protein